MAINIDRPFSDLALSFTRNPVTNDATRKLNKNAIKASIKNIIMTGFYERPFEPDVGSGIKQLLFEQFGSFTESKIKKAIIHAISKYEPRAIVEDVDIDSEPDNNRFHVYILFSIHNVPSPIEIDLFLERIR